MGEIKKSLKKFWGFLKEDSWQSFVVTLVLAFIIIRFIFFPLLSLVTGTVLPLVIVESCSMHHSSDLDAVLESNIYADYGISLEDSREWGFKNGLNKGDVIFVVGTSISKMDVGDVVIFDSGGVTLHPIIHRVIEIDEDEEVFTTKGDNNNGLLNSEKDIAENRIIGRAVFRIPYIGWAKLVFFDFQKPENERGFCS